MSGLVILQDSAFAADVVSVEPVRFHLSLNVSNLNDAVAFYRDLFGQPPAKHHHDYAKFDVQEPPVVFSLVPRPPGPGGSLSHLGLRVPRREVLDAYRTRLEAAGICTSNQDQTVCGYSRLDKLWLRDPDGNFWEIYHVDEDVPPESVRQSLSGAEARPAPAVTDRAHTWEHFITAPVPDHIPADDESLDEVLLTGTFNAELDEPALAGIVRDACRALKPGGRLSTHGLMGNRALGGELALPGMAALVRRVPDYQDVIRRIKAAGFVNVEITKFTDKPWFEIDGVALREVKIDAYRRPQVQDDSVHTLLYRGPFVRLRTDDGNAYTRGERRQVSADVRNALRQGSSADSFVFFEPGSSSCSTGRQD